MVTPKDFTLYSLLEIDFTTPPFFLWQMLTLWSIKLIPEQWLCYEEVVLFSWGDILAFSFCFSVQIDKKLVPVWFQPKSCYWKEQFFTNVFPNSCLRLFRQRLLYSESCNILEIQLIACYNLNVCDQVLCVDIFL